MVILPNINGDKGGAFRNGRVVRIAGGLTGLLQEVVKGANRLITKLGKRLRGAFCGNGDPKPRLPEGAWLFCAWKSGRALDMPLQTTAFVL